MKILPTVVSVVGIGLVPRWAHAQSLPTTASQTRPATQIDDHAGDPQPPPPTPGAATAPDGAPPSLDPFDKIGKFELGIRTTYSFPMSSIKNGTPLPSVVDALTGAELTVGYRGSQEVSLALFGHFGMVVGAGLPFSNANGVSGLCSTYQVSETLGGGNYDGSCSGYDFRGGLEVQVRPFPSKRLESWFSVSAGYEVLSLSSKGAVSGNTNTQISGQTYNASATYHGPFTKFMTGINFRLTPLFKIGPFIGIALGQYLSVKETTQSGMVASGTPDAGRLHEWLDLGIQGGFNL